MTMHRNPAHSSGQPTPPSASDAKSRVDDRLAVDATAEWPQDGRAPDEAAPPPPPSSTGQHRRPPAAPTEPIEVVRSAVGEPPVAPPPGAGPANDHPDGAEWRPDPRRHTADGNGADGHGPDGQGAPGQGTDGNTTHGQGLDGHGPDVHGLDGNGADGHGPARPLPVEDPEYFDDPQDLAEWVDNLVDAVTGENPTVPPAGPAEPGMEWPTEPAGAAEPAEPVEPTEPTGPTELSSIGEQSFYYTPSDHRRYDPEAPEFGRTTPALSRGELIDRYDALANLLRIGGGSLPEPLRERSRALLDHAGTRLRLSTDHTVVALAGGTGSGKSSMFNALCGLEFSTVGITRPTTSTVHACVWGDEGAAPVLDWLAVPRRTRHSRVSELDRGESELNGLILLDLPDHDSVQANHSAQVDRIVGCADLLIWVLDPQKYADAAVHHRFMTQLAGYNAVMVTVLNQVDKLTDAEIDDCLLDLRRLLEEESGGPVKILTTSVTTGEGIDGLVELIAETVRRRNASLDRLTADLARLVEEFDPFTRSTDSDRPGWERVGDGVPDRIREGLFEQLVEASGLSAIAHTAESSYERRGHDYVAWPVLRWLARMRSDPMERIQLDLRAAAGQGIDGPLGVQRAEVDAAVDEAAREVGAGLPEPWPRRVRAAARTDATRLADRIGEAVTAPVMQSQESPPWWPWVRTGQLALTTIAGISLAWFIAVAFVWTAGVTTSIPPLDDPVLGVLAAVVCVSLLLVGWLVDMGCRNLIAVAAARQREHVEEQGRSRLRGAVSEEIVAPIERELGQYRSFTAYLAAARGQGR